MHIHELIILRDLDTPREIEIFAFELKRIILYDKVRFIICL